MTCLLSFCSLREQTESTEFAEELAAGSQGRNKKAAAELPHSENLPSKDYQNR
jgi:hypothetical protein